MADNQDRTLALLGVAATKKPTDSTCPPENVMSAFIENRVDTKTRTTLLAHMSHCDDCYLTWETLSVFLAENQSDVEATQQQDLKKPGFFHRLGEWFNNGFSWQIALPGLALASLAIALVINIPHALYKSTRTDPAVVAATTMDADTLARSINRLPVPWENQTFGFSNTVYSSPVKAVGAGIWSARNALMNLKDPLPKQLDTEPAVNWKQSDFRDYYTFGQWTLNAWVLANAQHVKPAQWALLSQSVKRLEVSLKRHQGSEPESVVVLQAIGQMRGSLSRLSRSVDPAAQNALLREIETGLQKIFM